MVVDFYDVKGNYLTEIDLSESDIKILVRYAILDVLKKQEKSNIKMLNKIKKKLTDIDKLYEK